MAYGHTARKFLTRTDRIICGKTPSRITGIHTEKERVQLSIEIIIDKLYVYAFSIANGAQLLHNEWPKILARTHKHAMICKTNTHTSNHIQQIYIYINLFYYGIYVAAGNLMRKYTYIPYTLFLGNWLVVHPINLSITII